MARTRRIPYCQDHRLSVVCFVELARTCSHAAAGSYDAINGACARVTGEGFCAPRRRSPSSVPREHRRTETTPRGDPCRPWCRAPSSSSRSWQRRGCEKPFEVQMLTPAAGIEEDSSSSA